MLMSYRGLRDSLFKKNIQPKERSVVNSPAKLKLSVKELFVRRSKVKTEDNDSRTLPLLARDALIAGPQKGMTNIIVDPEVVEAMQSVFEALHDPSILDARRNQRYDLYVPFIIPETPQDITQSHELIHIYSPIREITTKHPHASHSVCPSVPAQYTQNASAAMIGVSRCLDVDIIEVMRIPRAASARGESSSLISEIPIEDLINVATAVSPTTPQSEASLSDLDVRMASNGTNHILDSSQRINSPITDAPRGMDAEDMKVLRFLGEGTTGKVYFVKDQVSRAKIALKVVEKKDKNEYTLSIIVQEVDILGKLADSPWFVQLYSSWHDRDNMYIAMTPYPTDLDSEMIRLVKLEPTRARFYMVEIIIALTELHNRGIIHRDVKAPNILIDREGHAVLADFGLSKDFCQRPSIAERVYQPYWPYLPHENPTSDTEPRDPAELYFIAWDYRGSELEMAPEIHLRQAYSFGVDFWSAAVVLYWMLTGRPPWYEQEDCNDPDIEVDDKPLALKIAEDNLFFDPSDDVDEVTKDFLQKMMMKNPKKRLMIDYEMPNHPYFAGVNWPLMEARAIPAPWIPEFEICHVYEPTSPVFTPGETYSEGEEDPYPTFTYLSKQAKRRVIYEECDDVDSDSENGFGRGIEPVSEDILEEDAEYACATMVDSPLNEDGVFGDKEGTSNADITLLDSPIIEWKVSEYQDSHALHFQSVLETSVKNVSVGTDTSTSQGGSVLPAPPFQEDLLKEGWDVTIISRPPTAPYSPGPKGWLHAQDLIRTFPRRPATTASASSSTSTSSVEIMYVLPRPADGTQDVQASNLTQLMRSDSPSPIPPSPQQQATVSSRPGFLSKAKVWWMSKTWTPKPKKNFGVKRLSC